MSIHFMGFIPLLHVTPLALSPCFLPVSTVKQEVNLTGQTFFLTLFSVDCFDCWLIALKQAHACLKLNLHPPPASPPAAWSLSLSPCLLHSHVPTLSYSTFLSAGLMNLSTSPSWPTPPINIIIFMPKYLFLHAPDAMLRSVLPACYVLC